MKTVGMYLVDLLSCYGVDTIFGIPGVHTVELYRGLADSSMKHVAARHEQALGFMADGYARISGRPGVCFVITGPGVTNIATAMAQAYADSIPMLVISSVNGRGHMGSGNGYLHELPNQQHFTSAVTEFSHTITAASELPQVLARAFAVFDGARPRPVHIEIPLDIIASSAEGLTLPRQLARASRGAAATIQMQQACALLRMAKRPLLIAGGGSLLAASELQQLAEYLDAPAIMTINARGTLPPEHPLGVSYSPSGVAVRSLLDNSDVILAVGTELGPTDFDMYAVGMPYFQGQLIRLDIDAQQVFRNQMPDIALVGDAVETLQWMLAELNTTPQAIGRKPTGAERVMEITPAATAELGGEYKNSVALLNIVRDTLPDVLMVGDSTQHVYAGNMAFAAHAPRRWFNASVGFGALGYGLPAAIGAGLAAPEQTVVCLAGDGGFQFSLGEMGTAVEAGVNLIVILLNNFGYGEIKTAMVASTVKPIGVDLHTPDFLGLAEAYGWHAERLVQLEMLPILLRNAVARGKPTLLELRVPAEY